MKEAKSVPTRLRPGDSAVIECSRRLAWAIVGVNGYAPSSEADGEPNWDKTDPRDIDENNITDIISPVNGGGKDVA